MSQIEPKFKGSRYSFALIIIRQLSWLYGGLKQETTNTMFSCMWNFNGGLTKFNWNLMPNS